MVCAAVDIPPRPLIMDAKTTYPKDVAKRWARFGSATRKQGFRISRSSLKDCPFGEITGCFHSALAMAAPPYTKETALAHAAPSTPSPAPGRVIFRPKTDTGRAGKISRKFRIMFIPFTTRPIRMGVRVSPADRSTVPSRMEEVLNSIGR